jgi:cytochrome P450
MNTSELDLFTEEALLDPWPIHKELRDAAPATYLPVHDVWAVPRYAEVRAALKDWESFTSREGVCVGTEFVLFVDTLLTSDPPRHTQLSKVFREKLNPGALREVSGEIEARADAMVAELVERREFDAITELADRFPVEVVADLVGLPEDGRDELRPRAAAAFNIFGPNNARAQESLPAFGAMFEYMNVQSSREQLTPDSFGSALYEAADRGDLPPEDVLGLMQAYLVAGMDTTVNALGSTIWLLAENPDQWELLREDPSLVRGAFDEAIRLESPVMGFTRTLVTDQDVGGVRIEAGQKVIPLLGSANRDERRWEEPERFDIRRDNSGHLAFGFGLHACTGRALAHIEGQAVLDSLIRRVKTISAGPMTRRINNQVRGLGSLPVMVEPVGEPLVGRA